MEDQQYCLRWNNHQPNFIDVFKSLLEFEELVDVTLSVEGKHIKAHKIILSACSPYFKLLFTMTPCKHPIVILNDIKYADLKIIVEFMYCGEINISDDQLADILEVAEVLQVRGLYDPNKKTESLASEKNSQTKKRKRKSEEVGVKSVNQTNPMCQKIVQGDTMIKADEVFEPSEFLMVNDEPYEYNDDFNPSIFLQGPESSPNVSDQENKNGLGSLSQCINRAISPQIKRPVPVPTPVRRRNSKVQESENFLLALEAVRSGSLGFCKAAKLYGLNNRTLWLEYKKRGYPATRPPVVTNKKSTTLSANHS